MIKRCAWAAAVATAFTATVSVESAAVNISSAGDTATSWSWKKMDSPGACYRDMAMISDTVGFAVAEQGIVVSLVKGNDGPSWATVLDAGGEYFWYGVHAFDAQNVLITGFIDGQKSLGVIRTTSDGGKTWSKDVIVDKSAWLTTNVQFKKDNKHGFVLAGEACHGWATSDGGKSWTHVPICDGWNADRFAMTDDGMIIATGTNYCVSPAGTWPPKFKCADPVDPDADGPAYVVSKSTYVVGGGDISPTVTGWVHVSNSAGKNWTQAIPLPFPIRVLFFSDESNGLAAGGDFQSHVGGIYETADGGLTWKLAYKSSTEHHAIESAGGKLFSVSCGSPGAIFVATKAAKLHRRHGNHTFA